MISDNSNREETEKNSYPYSKLRPDGQQYNYNIHMSVKKPISLCILAQKMELAKQSMCPSQAFMSYLYLSRQVLYLMRISAQSKFETKDIYPFLVKWIRNFTQIYQKSQCRIFVSPFSKFLFTLKKFISYSKTYEYDKLNLDLFRLEEQLKMSLHQQVRSFSINSSSSEIDNCFISLMDNKFSLPNDTCVSCTQSLFQRQYVSTNNLSNKIFVCLGEDEKEDQELLRKSYCSVLNSGGGVIMIGANKVINGYSVRGVSLENKDLANQKISFYYSLSKALHPTKFRINVDWVIVYPKFELQGRKDMRVCFRIKINPLEQYRMFYIQCKRSSVFYQAYGLDTSLKVIKFNIKQFEGDVSKNFYSATHLKYYLNEQNQKTHQGTECYKPQHSLSCSFPQYFASLSDTKGNEQQKQEKLLDNISKPKYHNTSILIPAKKKGGRQMIREILCCLENKKIAIQIQQPFRKSFSEQSMPRLVYMISHQIHFLELKKLLNQLAFTDVFKWTNLILMPVYNNLEIELEKVKETGEQILQSKLLSMQKKFQSNFVSSLHDVCEENQIKRILRYQFNDINQSIYAYLIFQSLQLKPYFKKVSWGKSCQI